MIKVGVIGNGKIAKEHVDSYARLAEEGKAVLEVFCDRTSNRQVFVKVDQDGNETELTGHLNQPVYYNEITL